eukprot:9768685-Alexandrium_andersonii.AAC.1
MGTVAKLEPNDQALMRRILANGIWTDSMMDLMCKREGDEKTPCRWCGEPEADHEHVFWACERFAACRVKVWGQQPMPAQDELPRALRRCGLAPSLVLPQEGDERSMLWGPGLTRPSEVAQWEVPGPAERGEIEDLARRRGVVLWERSLEQLERATQGDDRHEELPALQGVQGEPPPQPNVYTDGSLKPPNKPSRAVTGI